MTGRTVARADTVQARPVQAAPAAAEDHLAVAVDLALVVDVLSDSLSAAKDLGVLNIAGALPFAIAPALAPGLLSLGRGSYPLLYAVAGTCALFGAAAILPVKRVP